MIGKYQKIHEKFNFIEFTYLNKTYLRENFLFQSCLREFF